MNPETLARLLIRCADRPGIVAAATTFLYHHGANITELDQHSTDPIGGQLFMRLEFQTPALDRQVLARAVRWHVEDRIIVDGNKTVVFN